jgi:MvdD pre-ATP grasp domain
MLLIITNSIDSTADHLTAALGRGGVPFIRFDTDKCLSSLRFNYRAAAPRIHINGVTYAPDDFTNVWYRRPERLRMPGANASPETEFTLDEWSAALEGFFAHIPEKRWMNHPAREAVASHKLHQLTRAVEIGFTIPDTLVTQEPDELHEFYSRHGGRVIAKPMANGHVERKGNGADTLIFTNRVRAADVEDCSDLAGCPTLFQAEVSKRSDVRITVVDCGVHAVELIAGDLDGQQRCDIRRNHMSDVMHTPVSPPPAIRELVMALVASYGLRYSAIDMAIDKRGEWIFFEINPNGQWAWMDLKGASDIASTFVATFRTGSSGC